MFLNFCTLFNTYYLSRGVALYESLVAQTDQFHLYIFAFDDKTFEILTRMQLEHATIIPLRDFENEDLLRVKPDRSIGEYCWTSTSSSIRYCLDNFKLDHCIYLDADLYFFKSPQLLIDELRDSSVTITEHRYTAKYDQSKISGKYCVQFMFFRDNPEARKCLDWWVDACIDWCYAKPEDGKFGDQKYLDDWCERFDGVHELQHLGGGVAPWNCQQYHFSETDGILVGTEQSSGKEFPVVFYHFHDVHLFENGQVDLGIYDFDDSVLNLVYKPYFTHLKRISDAIKLNEKVDPDGTRKNERTLRGIYRIAKRKLKGTYNRFELKALMN